MPIRRFSDLISPLTPKSFFERFWEKAPLHVEGDAERFASILRLDDVDRLMLAGRGSQRRVLKIVPSPGSGRGSENLSFADTPMARLYRAFSQGDTLVVNGAQRLWAPLARQLAVLRDTFGPRVHCNLYLTPAGSQGFPFHCDGHDVLVLQVGGAKRWWIYRPVYPFPMDSLSHLDWLEAGAQNRIEEKDAELIEEVTVEQGDFLYVPRGFYHKVVSVEESPSLHLTLSIHPRFWVDAVKTSVEVAARDHEGLRRTLPVPGAVEAGCGGEPLESIVPSLLETLDGVDLDETLTTLGKSQAFEAPMVPSGHFRDLLRSGEIDLDTVLERRPGLSSEIHFLGGGVKVSLIFGEKRFTGPGPIWPALEYFRDHRRVRVGDLPLPEKMGDQSKIVLARRLVREGFLRFARDDQASGEMPSPASTSEPTSAARCEPTFDDLVAPLDRDAFFADVFEQTCRVFRGRRAFGTLLDFERFDDLLWVVFGSDSDLVEIVSPGGVETPWVQNLRLDRLYSAFAGGRALRVERLEAVWPEAALLVADAVRAFSAEATACAVAKPAGFPATPVEWIQHDSFLLQLDGRSTWDTYAGAFELPSDTSRFRLALHPEASTTLDPEAVEPTESFSLDAGDVLYSPRGTYRRQKQGDDASLLLELKIRPITWSDLAKTALDARADESPELRRSLPPSFAHDAAIRDQVREEAASLETVPGAKHFEAALDAIRKVHVWHRAFPADGHFSQLARLDDLDAETVLERRPGLDAGVGGPYGDTVRVVFAEHRIQGPEKILEALRFLAENARFRVADLPLDEASRAVLARRLIKEGLLRVANDR